MRRLIRILAKKAGTLLPKNLLTSTGLEFEGFDTFAEWTAESGVGMEADTVNFRTGTASLKVTTSVGSTCSVKKTISKVFGTAPRMRLNFYLHDSAAELSTVQVKISSNSTFSINKLGSVGFSSGFHAGWNTVDIYPTDWTDTGG